MNISYIPFDYVFKPTKECFEWCKEQITVAHSGIVMEGNYLIAIALIGMVAFNFIVTFNSFIISKTNIDDETLRRLAFSIIDFTTYILVGYLVYQIWLL